MKPWKLCGSSGRIDEPWIFEVGSCGFYDLARLFSLIAMLLSYQRWSGVCGYISVFLFHDMLSSGCFVVVDLRIERIGRFVLTHVNHRLEQKAWKLAQRFR